MAEWPSSARARALDVYRGGKAKRPRDDDVVSTIDLDSPEEGLSYCKVPANKRLPPPVKNFKNGNERFLEVPEYNVVSPGDACMLASVEMLLRVARPDLPTPMPAMYIQRACNPGSGIDTFRRLLEMVMEFSANRALWPEDGQDYEWLGRVDYFRVFTGAKAAAVFERLVAHEKDDVPYSGAFAFYDGGHAYTAAPRHLLRDDGRADRERVYAFNVSNIGSTTSVKSREWFRKMFATKPDFEILCADQSIGDEAPLARLPGVYLWNEDGRLWEV